MKIKNEKFLEWEKGDRIGTEKSMDNEIKREKLNRCHT